MKEIVFEILNDMAEDLSVLQLKKLQEVLHKRFAEVWYFSIVDVVQVLTEQPDVDGARNYWKVLKKWLKDEGNQLVTNCNQLKMKSSKDGKRYKTDVANTEQLLRIEEIESSRYYYE